MSHYETLGVAKDSTSDEIKHAFRRCASEAHPDREGGDAERMALVNKAYEVLGNPERRERYDTTGSDVDQKSPEFQARDMLLQMLAGVLDSGATQILAELQRLLRQNRLGLEQSLDQYKAKVRKLEKQRGKVRVKKGDDLVEMLITQQLANCEQVKAQIARALTIMDAADLMLKDWEEDAPPPPPIIQYPDNRFYDQSAWSSANER